MWGAGTGPDRPLLLSWAGHIVLAGVGAEEGVVGREGGWTQGLAKLQLTTACNALAKPSDTPTHPPLHPPGGRHLRDTGTEGVDFSSGQASGASKH